MRLNIRFAGRESTKSPDGPLWDMLSAYLDGETSPQETARLEAALQSDARLIDDLKLLRGTRARLRALEWLDPPERLRAAILRATIYRPSPFAVLAAAHRRIAPVALTTGAAAALALAVLVLRPGADPQIWRAQSRLSSVPRTPGEALVLSSPPGISTGERETLPSGTVSTRAAPTGATYPRAPVGAAGRILTVQPAADATRNPAYAAAPPVPAPNSVADTAPPSGMARVAGRAVLADLPPTAPDTPGPADQPAAGPQQVAEAFVYHPGMDAPDQQLIQTMDENARAGAEPDLHTVIDAVTASPATERADRSAPGRNAAADVDRGPGTHWGHLIVSDLPPRPSLSNGDIKRVIAATRLGYDRLTLAAIHRHQASLCIVGGRF